MIRWVEVDNEERERWDDLRNGVVRKSIVMTDSLGGDVNVSGGRYGHDSISLPSRTTTQVRVESL